MKTTVTIDADNAISAANFDTGVYIQKNSYGNFRRSLSCFNGGHGFLVSDSSTGKFHNHYNDDVSTWVGAGGTATIEDERYGWSNRSGSFSFRNGMNGFYIKDNSNADLSHSRSSYNGHSGIKITNASNITGSYLSSYRNGTQSATEGPKGIYAERYSSGDINFSRSVGNTGAGYQTDKGSYVDANYSASRYNNEDGYNATRDSTIGVHGATAENEPAGVTGFHADLDSQIYADTQTSGTTHESNGSNVRYE